MDNNKTPLNEISEENAKQIKEDLLGSDVITRDLLRALQLGSHDAYRSVYLHWRKPICHLLLKLTGSEADADDITQNVFIRLWENHHKIDPEKNIKSLLYLIARRSAINHFEKKKVRSCPDDKAGLVPVDFEDSYEIIVAKETELLKEAALSRMSVQRRTIYLLSVEDGLSAEQVARKVGVSRETVYNQLSAARKDLRDLITLFLILFVAP